MADLWITPEIYRTREKTGQGAFKLVVHRDGRVQAEIDGGPTRDFASPRHAYDYYREMHDTTGDHAYWNVCYHLEDYLSKSAN